jgi:hypothetical protein
MSSQVQLQYREDAFAPRKHCQCHKHQVLLTDEKTGELVCPICLANPMIFTSVPNRAPRFTRELLATGSTRAVHLHCKGHKF